MAETSEVLPACPWPTSATFLTFSPVYTFTGSPPSEATNLTQLKLQAQLGGGLWASALGLRIGLAQITWGRVPSPVRSSDSSTIRASVWVGQSCATSCRFPNPRAMLGARCTA